MVKRKIYSSIIAVVILSALSIPAAFASVSNTSNAIPDSKKQINLTEEQKKELKQISDQMYELKKQMVKKYVEFGVMTKEQGDKSLERLEEKQKMMEKNGYMPKFKKDFHKRDKERKPKTDVEQHPET